MRKRIPRVLQITESIIGLGRPAWPPVRHLPSPAEKIVCLPPPALAHAYHEPNHHHRRRILFRQGA